MSVDHISVHLLLAVILFFLMNWIGGHSVTSARYHQIGYFSRYDASPAFNVVFRVLTPVVYLVLVSTILYGLDLDTYVRQIWLVALYHILGRWLFNIVYGRHVLLIWPTQIGIAMFSVGLSYLAYRQILVDRARVLPDVSTIANELWIAVLLFLYKLFDHVAMQRQPTTNTTRQNEYIRHRYARLRRKYRAIIEAELGDRRLHPLAYAILIYETFNRPAIIQWLERHVFRHFGARSLGPMQLQVARAVSDKQIVTLGCQKIAADYAECARDARTRDKDDGVVHLVALYCAAGKFNIRSDYPVEVMTIHDLLVAEYFAD